MTTAARTPFTAVSTAAQVLDGVDLTGHRAVVTGGASGIGIETARALAGAGASVTVAVRDIDAGVRAAEDIRRSTGNDVLVGRLDLADPASIAAFARSWDGPLHMLVNNAGVMACPLGRTARGFEMQFATNHLGHFALAKALFPSLRAADGARVVSVTSNAHLRSPIHWDDVHYHHRPYDPSSAYAQSKTANVLFAVAANERWSHHGITVNAVMPGGIRTALQRHVGASGLERRALQEGDQVRWKTARQGAATSVLVVASPLLDGVGGRYFEDCAEAAENRPGTRTGYAPHAVDPEAAERLWDLSAAMTS